MITLMGAYPSLELGALRDSHEHNIGAILRDSLAAEGAALELYRELLAMVKDRSVMLEEYCRKMIAVEELHAGAVDKMLRKPGEVAAYRQRESLLK